MNLTCEGARPKGSYSQASESDPTCAQRAVPRAWGRRTSGAPGLRR